MYNIIKAANKTVYKVSDCTPSNYYNVLQNTETKSIQLSEVRAYATTAYNILNSHFLEKENFLFKALINQRKVHRYYKSMTELEHSLIDENEFHAIEQSCILTIENLPEENLKIKLSYFYDMLKKHFPEEIDFINNEDLSELFSVPEHKINILHYKLENA